MNNIHNISNNGTRANYLASIKKFGTDDIDWKDMSKMVKILDIYPLPTRFNMTKALYIYSGRDDTIRELMVDVREQYTAKLILEKKEAVDIDWCVLVNEMFKQRQGGKEQYMMFIYTILSANHPRRFKDYRLISTQKGGDANYWNRDTRVIEFTIFKNVKSVTRGNVQVRLSERENTWLGLYVDKYNINGLLFNVNDRRLNYLIDKYKIPRSTVNRKFQETRLLRRGENPYKVSKIFNHSVGIQQIHYCKHL
jgi:hypothetical protein